MTNFSAAIEYASLVQAAYLFDLDKAGTSILPSVFDPYERSYRVVGRFSANDLRTDVNLFRSMERVQIGYVFCDAETNVVVAIRGTEGIFEWINDAIYLQKDCPVPNGKGQTEDGFSDMYTTLRSGIDGKGTRLFDALEAGDMWKGASAKSLTICGHSLGSSLATLLAYEIGLNSTVEAFKPVHVYTFASPRTGDPVFAMHYNEVVPSTVRIFNHADIVPHLPMETPFRQVPFYHHVDELVPLNPFDDQGADLIDRTVRCHHSLTSYIYLMERSANDSKPFALDEECKPRPL